MEVRKSNIGMQPLVKDFSLCHSRVKEQREDSETKKSNLQPLTTIAFSNSDNPFINVEPPWKSLLIRLHLSTMFHRGLSFQHIAFGGHTREMQINPK
jgi:hypothetical protein